MKQLKKYVGKEVKAELRNHIIIEGYVYEYYRTNRCNDKDTEYYIGYDGGEMEYVKPSMIINIEEIA